MKTEFSKKLLNDAKWLFVSQLIVGVLCAVFNKETTLFCYTVPATGTVYATAAAFYYNKAKIENICKGRIDFLKFKIRIMEIVPEDRLEEIESELAPMESALSSKMDSAFEETINEDINIQNL